MAVDRFMSKTAAAFHPVSFRLGRGGGEGRLTSISNLAGIAAGRRGSPLRKRNANLGESLERSPRPDAVVLAHHDLLPLAVRALDPGPDGCDLVVEVACLLRHLGAAEALGGVLVHLLAGDAEVAADVLARPAHGLHAVLGVLGLVGDLLVEGLLQAVSSDRHLLRADGDADLDRAARDLVRDVGRGLQAGRAEAVDAGGPGRDGETGRQGRSPELVRRLAIGNLESEAIG